MGGRAIGKKNIVSEAPGIDEMLCQVVDNLS
jgi:hypothetical protein